MENFLYILGAGASAGSHSTYGRDGITNGQIEELPNKKRISIDQVIPTIYRIGNRVEALAHKLKTEAESAAEINAVNYLVDISKELQILGYQLAREPYPDILAETFNAINPANYDKLVKMLSYYFLLEQMYRGVDSRYKVFLTNLLAGSNNFHLPPGLKIFSWNYDYQFEEALVEKRNQVGLDNWINSAIHAYDFKPIDIDDKFSLIKINGSATHFQTIKAREEKITNKAFDLIQTSNPSYYNDEEPGRLLRRKNLLKEAGALYKFVFTENVKSSIRFAWQKGSSSNLIASINALKSLEHVQEITAIGYSFPPLNFMIDSSILLKCKKLHLIWLQIDKDDFDTVKKRIISIFSRAKVSPPEINHVSHLQDFYIPENLLGSL